MRRSKVTLLPKDVRAELDRRLVEGSFSNYRGLAKWLDEHGFHLAPSTIQRYGHSFEERLAAVTLASKQAQAVTEAAPDNEGAMTDALARLVQEKIFATLVEADQISEGDVAKIARAVADLGRATISQKRWADQVRARLGEQKRAAMKKLHERRGIPDELAQEMRNILLGIDPLPNSPKDEPRYFMDRASRKP
jgi:Protein of unknown function (DUF3486)